MRSTSLYVLDCEHGPDSGSMYRAHCIDNVSFGFHSIHNLKHWVSPGDRLDLSSEHDIESYPSSCPPTDISRESLPHVIRTILLDLEPKFIRDFRGSNFSSFPNVSTRIEQAMESYSNNIHDFRDLSTVIQEDAVNVLSKGFLSSFDIEPLVLERSSLWDPDGSSDFEFAEKLNAAGELELSAGFYSRSSNRGYGPAVSYLSSDALKDMPDGIIDEDSYRRCIVIDTVTEGDDPIVSYRLASHYETCLRQIKGFRGASATRILELYRKAASKGDVRAYYRIGYIHQHGLGRMSPNVSKAVKAYRKCGDHPDALFRMASCYESTFDYTVLEGLDGVSASYICNLFRRAADLGNQYARNRITLDIGDDVDPMSFMESRLLAYAGDRYAMYVMALCYESGSAGEVSYEKAIGWYRDIVESVKDGEDVFSETICFAEGIPDLNVGDLMYRIGELYELTHLSDFGSALCWYRKAADSGNVRARRLIDIDGADSMPEHERFRTLMLHSEEGDDDILLRISICYESGIGVRRDLSLAGRYRNILADRGHDDSQLWMGDYIERTARTESEMADAIGWYRKASENGNVRAKDRLDVSDIDHIPRSELFAKCRLFMYSDDPRMQYLLGLCYECGYGVSVSYGLARSHYQKAASLGSQEAKDRLDVSRIGELSGIDRYRRLMLFSDDPDPYIHRMIARSYLDGDVVSRSEPLAFDWFASASRLGDVESSVMCADMILSGAIRYDRSVALSYLRTAADNGDMASNRRIGMLLSEPGSDTKGHPEAVKRLRLAAHSNDPEAQYLLGRMFEKGLGMPKFYSEAFRWYSLAAGQGHFEAKYRRMLLLWGGRGTGKDTSSASSLYSQLRERDPERLSELMGRCIRGKDELSIGFAKANLD